MKTHKNPALRTGPAPFKRPATAPKPVTTAKPKAAAVAPAAKPPVVELQGKKWVVVSDLILFAIYSNLMLYLELCFYTNWYYI